MPASGHDVPVTSTLARAANTGGSVVVDRCQVCDSRDLEPIIFVGYLPPVNEMPAIGTRPAEQPAYPAQVLRCRRCELVQLGLIVDPAILFPPSYPYLSGTTRILRENFAELYREAAPLLGLRAEDLIVDIGSNDGTLLRNFKDAGHRVRGIEPTGAGDLANERGIPTDIAFFDRKAVDRVLATAGPARVITATNVFAHIEGIHDICDAVVALLAPDGVFISESHYWLALVETLQYDTIYHEHLRHYTLGSLTYLLGAHGLEVIHAKRIPTHGGSIRVYAARKGARVVQPTVAALLAAERAALTEGAIERFRRGVVASKLGLYALLRDIKERGERVYGIGAPSRASTLINYVGLDDGILDCVLEIEGSHKIGKYVPGTLIPVLNERKLNEDQPEHALLLSWHIADELMPKLTASGFQGSYIVPLPTPRIVGRTNR
jgi:hypothetical protein